MDAERSAKLFECIRPCGNGNDGGPEAPPKRAHVIAEENDKIGFQCVHAPGDRSNAGRGHPWLDGVDIRQHADP